MSSLEFTYDDVTDTYTLNRYGVIIVLDLSSVAGNGFNATRLAKIKEAAQVKLFDTRVLRDTLDADDPARLADPALQHGEKMFWETDQQGNVWVVSREWILDDLQWDGNALIPTVRRAMGV